MTTIDHLVYATPDLDATVDDLEAALGVRATPGGSHPGRGSRNALIALSDISYLEIIGPDPAQGSVAPSWFGIDRLTGPKLVTWAAKTDDVDAIAARAASLGVPLGAPAAGSRRTTSGVLLEWRFTSPMPLVADGLVPFFIDWGNSPHPASTAPGGLVLLALRAEHPSPERVEPALWALDVTLPLTRGGGARLIATIRAPRGVVELD